MPSNSKLSQEYHELKTYYKSEEFLVTINGSDYSRWKVQIKGPKASPYAGAVYDLTINFPFSYPLDPPSLSFDTPIYHPNIADGRVGLDIVDNKWTPLFSAKTIIFAVIELLKQPDINSGVIDNGIALLYRRNPLLFETKARSYMVQHIKRNEVMRVIN